MIQWCRSPGGAVRRRDRLPEYASRISGGELTLDGDTHGAGGAGDDLRCAFEAGGVEVFHLGGGDLVDLGLGQLGDLDGVRGS